MAPKEERRTTITITTITSILNDSRIKEGQRRRRFNISKLKNENIELRETVKSLTKEIQKLWMSQSLTPTPDLPAKVFFNHVNSHAK